MSLQVSFCHFRLKFQLFYLESYSLSSDIPKKTLFSKFNVFHADYILTAEANIQYVMYIHLHFLPTRRFTSKKLYVYHHEMKTSTVKNSLWMLVFDCLLSSVEKELLQCTDNCKIGVLLLENLHAYFELSAQAWILYKAPQRNARYPNSCPERIKLKMHWGCGPRPLFREDGLRGQNLNMVLTIITIKANT